MEITNYALVEISRANGPSILKVDGIDNDRLNYLLIHALPVGTLESRVSKTIDYKGFTYTSYVIASKSEDAGIALILQSEYTSSTLDKVPVGYLERIFDVIAPFLNNTTNIPEKLDVDFSGVKYVKPTYDYYENLDSLFYSVLTEQKTLVLGESEELITFMLEIYLIFPAEVKKLLTSITNSTNLSDDVVLHVVRINDETLKIADHYQGKHTILFLPNKQVYGKYTSPFCKTLAQLYSEKKIDELRTEISQFYAKAIASNEMPPVADFAAKNNLTKADASLMLWMRANQYNIEIEKNLLEEL